MDNSKKKENFFRGVRNIGGNTLQSLKLTKRTPAPGAPQPSGENQVTPTKPNPVKLFSARLNRDGLTPLHEAVIEANEDALKDIFKQKGFDVDIRDKKDRRTALQWAARLGHVAIVEDLLGKKPSVNIKDNDDRTALQWAAIEGRMGVVLLLLRKGANIAETSDRFWRTALHWAAMKGYDNIVRELIKTDPSIIDSADFHGRTALIWAAMEGHSIVVETLISEGASSKSVDKLHERSALHWAAYNGHPEVVRTYLTHPKQPIRDVPLGDIGGQTATHLAAEQGYADVVQVLVESAANIGLVIGALDGYRRIPIHRAAQNGHKTVAELLLSRKADSRVDNKLGETSEDPVNTVDVDGRTPLFTASAHGQDHMVKFLLLQDAKTALEDKSGQTALHTAAQNGHPTTVQILLDKDKGNMQSMINKKDNIGRTALDWAAAEERGGKENQEEVPVDAQLEVSLYEQVKESVGRNERGKGIGIPLQWAEGHQEKEKEKEKERTKPEETALQVLLGADADLGVNRDSKLLNQESRSALELAAWRGNIRALKVLLEHKDTGSTFKALYWAARGYDEAVRVESRSENLLPEKDRRATLYWPPLNDSQQVVLLLLEKERNPKRPNEELVSQLLKNNATLEAKDVLRQIALRFAICNGDDDLVKKVLDDGTSKRFAEPGKAELDIGVNLHIRDYGMGQTVLHLAVQQKENAQKMVKLLLDYKAPVKAKDRKRQSALHLAAKAGNHDVLEKLLADIMDGEKELEERAEKSTGIAAFIKAKDYDGRTAIDVAKDEDARNVLVKRL